MELFNYGTCCVVWCVPPAVRACLSPDQRVELHRSRRKHQNGLFPFLPERLVPVWVIVLLSSETRARCLSSPLSGFVMSCTDRSSRTGEWPWGTSAVVRLAGQPEEKSHRCGSVVKQDKWKYLKSLKNLVKMFGVEANAAAAEWKDRDVTEIQRV